MGKRRKLLSWKQAGHILRQRSRKVQDLSRERMGKGKSDRMQGLAADVPEVGIVEKVPGKGMADIFHMGHGSGGCVLSQDGDAGATDPCFYYTEAVHTGWPRPLRGPGPGSAGWPSPPSARWGRRPFRRHLFSHRQRPDIPGDLPALHLAGEKGGAEPVFCHQEKAGRVFIQTD